MASEIYLALAKQLEGYDELLAQRETLAQKALEDPSCREELVAIDHRLDLLGEDPKERLEELLLQCAPPAQCEEFVALIDKKNAYETSKVALLPIYRLLVQGKRAMVQKRGLFSFIFSRHPKVELSQCLRRSLDAAKQARKVSHLPEANEALDHLIEEIEKPWNAKLYQKHFLELERTFSELIAHLEEQINVLNKEIGQKKASIHAWIEANGS